MKIDKINTMFFLSAFIFSSVLMSGMHENENHNFHFSFFHIGEASSILNDTDGEKISILNPNISSPKQKPTSTSKIEPPKDDASSRLSSQDTDEKDMDVDIDINEVRNTNNSDVNIQLHKKSVLPISESSVKSVLGHKKEEWAKILEGDGFQQYHFHSEFLNWVDESAKELKEKRNSMHYESINSRRLSAREKRKKNPLLQVHPQKNKSKFITDLSLDAPDFIKMINLIPELKDENRNGYSNQDVAKILPYIALCFNYDIPYYEVRYYIRQFTQYGTPVDIVTYRLNYLVESKTFRN